MYNIRAARVCVCVDVSVTGCTNRADKPTQSSSVSKEDEECGARPLSGI